MKRKLQGHYVTISSLGEKAQAFVSGKPAAILASSGMPSGSYVGPTRLPDSRSLPVGQRPCLPRASSRALVTKAFRLISARSAATDALR